MAESSLSALLTAVHATGAATVPTCLSGARSAFGGVPVAIAVAAAERALFHHRAAAAGATVAAAAATASLPPLRVLHTSFVAPVFPGPVTTTATVIRQGRSAAVVRAEALQGDQVVTAVTATFGAPKPSARPSLVPARLAATIPSWRATPPFVPSEAAPAPAGAAEASSSHDHWQRLTPPTFLAAMDVRYVKGGPRADGTIDAPQSPFEPEIGLWMRWKDDAATGGPSGAGGGTVAAAVTSLAPLAGPHASARFVALCDMTWPPPVARLAGRGILVASLAWSFEFFPPAPTAAVAATPMVTEAGWIYHAASLCSAGDGYTSLTTHTFDTHGAMRAAARQTLAYWDTASKL